MTKKIFDILSSVDFWKIVFPLLIAIFVWNLDSINRLKWEQYQRKENNYKELIKAVRGFYISTSDVELKQKFIEQINLSWLYAPDEVIMKAYKFLETVHTGQISTDKEKEKALGDFVLSIRKDLLSRKTTDETELLKSDFKHLISTELIK